MLSANYDGDTFNYIHTPRRVLKSTKKTLEQLARQIFNNKSLRAKNRIRKLGRLCAVVTIR